MKKTAIFFSILILSLSSCFLWKDISFNFSDSVDVTIPATSSLLPFDLPIPTVSTSSTQAFENQGVLPSQIKDVTLDNLTMTITSPQDQTFAFLDAIYIYIQKSDGSEEQEIAYAENIESDSQSITLQTTGINLVDYINDPDGYKLRIKVKVKQVLSNDVDLHIDLNFKVTARVF